MKSKAQYLKILKMKERQNLKFTLIYKKLYSQSFSLSELENAVSMVYNSSPVTDADIHY